MIKINNISKKWKGFEIKNLSLEINDNEYFCILGPSGSGKTLLLELISGIYLPDSGEIYLNGENITFDPLENRGIMFVYQNYMLFPHKTVFENIAFGLNIRNVKKDEIKLKVNEIMELLSISHLSNRLPRTLSGGEQQRTALARALILQPKVILMDEPLSALDKKIKEELMKELRKIHEEFDITIIHVTHNFDEALMLADRIAVIKKGEIIQVGNLDDIFRHPSSTFVADFVGVENIFQGIGKKTNEGLTIVDTGNISIYSSQRKEGTVHVSLRPEYILVSLDKVKTSAKNVFKGEIKEIIDKGALIQLMIDIKEPLIVFLTHQSFSEMELNIGKEVWVHFKATSVNIF
ncbi:MAG: ABC transporter ATP-binding protein [Methanobrevibacter sp.]|jgi:molybdate/tungstate transport system ATP-binding protein|nr:ABC transporter ATP-binding protein [Candidatus Methanovirga meridionalis]